MYSIIEFRREAVTKGLKEREIEALIGWVKFNTPRGREPVFPTVDEVLKSVKESISDRYTGTTGVARGR